MTDQPYTKAVAKLTIGDRIYTVEADIDPAFNLNHGHFSDACFELEQQNNLVIRDANYTDPMGSGEPVYDGILELGGIRPAVGGSFNAKRVQVKVLFN